MAQVSFSDYSSIVRGGNVVWSTIGRFCSIAEGAGICPGNHATWRVAQHHFTDRAAQLGPGEDDDDVFQWRRDHWVTIGHDVWIGHGVTFLPGVTISAGGRGVKGRRPPQIVGGVPACQLKWRFDQHQAGALQGIAWWDRDHARLKEALPDIRARDIHAFIAKYR